LSVFWSLGESNPFATYQRTDKWLAGYIFGGDGKESREGTRGVATLDRIDYPTFCEVGSCSDLAIWRVGYQSEKGEFCPRHTVSVMKNRRIWHRRVWSGKE
jgi:hypothetical protein